VTFSLSHRHWQSYHSIGHTSSDRAMQLLYLVFVVSVIRRLEATRTKGRGHSTPSGHAAAGVQSAQSWSCCCSWTAARWPHPPSFGAPTRSDPATTTFCCTVSSRHRRLGRRLRRRRSFLRRQTTSLRRPKTSLTPSQLTTGRKSCIRTPDDSEDAEHLS